MFSLPVLCRIANSFIFLFIFVFHDKSMKALHNRSPRLLISMQGEGCGANSGLKEEDHVHNNWESVSVSVRVRV